MVAEETVAVPVTAVAELDFRAIPERHRVPVPRVVQGFRAAMLGRRDRQFQWKVRYQVWDQTVSRSQQRRRARADVEAGVVGAHAKRLRP